MPSLKLCGQPSFIGGDDIRCCVSWYWLLRLLQLACLLPLIVMTTVHTIRFDDDDEDKCRLDETKDSLMEERGLALMAGYVWVSFAYVMLQGILVEVHLWVVSGWGTPTMPGDRSRQVRWGIYIKFGLLGIVALGLTLWGVILWGGVTNYCNVTQQDLQQNPCLLERQDYCRNLPTEAWRTLLAILVVSQFMETGAATLVMLNLARKVLRRPVRTTIQKGRTRRGHDSNTCCCWTRQSSIQCLTWCCCSLTSLVTMFCTGGGETPLRGDFATLAALLDDFVGDAQSVDIVFSDILMSLLMLRRLQKQRRLEIEGALSKSTQLLQHDERSNNNPDGRSILRIQESPEEDVEHGASASSQVVDVDKEVSGSKLISPSTTGQSSTKQQKPRVTRMASIPILNSERPSVNSSQDPTDVSSRISASVMSRALLCPKENAGDAWILAEGAHYMKLAVAIYTLIMQMLHHPTQECWNVFCKGTAQHLCCTRPRRKRKERNNHRDTTIEEQPTFSEGAVDSLVLGDNCCGWHETSFLHRAGLTETELVYASFRIGVTKTPYAIVLDHDAQSVVVIIRGTLSLDDLMADLAVQPESLDPWNDECFFGGMESGRILDVDATAIDSAINDNDWNIGGEFAHKGILDCAAWVFEDLKDQGILDRLLLGDKAGYKDYSLRVIGHSLGAGVACLVGLFLRTKYLKSNNLRCLCFCPPGCTVSRTLAEKSKDFMTSFVLDSDFVPRLSLQGLENLRDDILHTVARVKVSKHKARERYGAQLDFEAISEKNAQILYENDEEIPLSDYEALLVDYQRDQQARRLDRSIENVPLWPPGRIVYLANAGTVSSPQNALKRMLAMGNEETRYQPIWADTADFREIELTVHFLDDHDPENVLRELERVAAKFDSSASLLSAGQQSI
mmetsp:Transcript_2914/g.8183  ORF Transcript_2914/g.8183 Transcript_2914/m.8183 type:complete len:904 (-) Transcript_2914:89-2800(-)